MDTEDEVKKRYGRERGGYEYLDSKFNYVHATSIPRTDDEALAYFDTVAGWDADVTFVQWRPHTGPLKYTMLPVRYEGGEVKPL